MAHDASGLKAFLEFPNIYDFCQNILGADKARKEIVSKYLKLKDGHKVLDIGCGTSEILRYIKEDISYTGIDFNPEYISTARKRYGRKGIFICDDLNKYDFADEKFDRIMVFGVLHHLDDSHIDDLMKRIKNLLKPDGALFCLENTYTEKQVLIDRLLKKMDRGQNIKKPEGYERILRKQFSKIEINIRSNLLHIPYTHFLAFCSNQEVQ